MKSAPVFGILEAALRLLHFVAATLAVPLRGCDPLGSSLIIECANLMAECGFQDFECDQKVGLW